MDEDRATRRHVVCVQLKDDFSGSAKVLAQVMTVLRQAGYDTQCFVGSHGSKGFIRASFDVETYIYRAGGSRLVTMCSYALSQVRLLLRLVALHRRHAIDVIYVNTVLPVGAILAGAVLGVPVVTHIHEVMLGSRSLFHALLRIVRRHSSFLVCVSQYVAAALSLPEGKAQVIHNALDEGEWELATRICRERRTRHQPGQFTVVMASSMKWYKGLDSYLELATRCGAADHEIRFVLALNADEWEVGLFRKHFRIPANVQIVVRPPSLYAYYEVADLVVNLSHREGWIETFGLTLLEAMACGVPVVAPREGGCTEVVTDNAGGWLIDSKDIDGLLALILRLQADSKFWLHHSQHARRNAERFRESTFKKQLLQLFERVP